MSPDEVAAYALGKAGAWPDTPWENDRVAKVGPGAAGGKIFAFLGDDTVGVKCGNGRDGTADEWLDRYPEDASVMAYIGRSGWNTLRIDGAIPDEALEIETPARSTEPLGPRSTPSLYGGGF